MIKCLKNYKLRNLIFNNIFFSLYFLPGIQYIVYILTFVPFGVFQTFIVNLEA